MFGYLILISRYIYDFISLFSPWCSFLLRRYIKHLRQSLTAFPNSSKFLISNTSKFLIRNTLYGIFRYYYIKHERRCFMMHSRVSGEIQGVWIANETLYQVFDISFQLKQKLRSKQRSKIVKIYAY